MALVRKMPRTLSLATLFGLVLATGASAKPETPAKPPADKPAPKPPAAPPADKLKVNAPDADKIIASVEDRPDGKDQTSTVTLEIQPKKGTKRIRQLNLLRKEAPDMTKLVTVFISPADVRDAAFLVWDEHNKPDRRWLYLPAIGQVRRLSSGEDRSSFFGSDFVYEDLTNRDPEQDTHTFVATQKVGTWDCWVIDSTPKNAKGLDFVRYRSWVWKDDPIFVRQEYYDAAGKVVRRGQTLKLQKVQNIWTWHQGTMENVKTGSKTLLEVTSVKYNTGIADERFMEDQLSRGAP